VSRNRWLATRAALKYATKANKAQHIFAPKHNLGPLVAQLGSQRAVVKAILDGLKGKTPVSGIFNVTIKIGGHSVVVRGAVDNGVVKIGAAFVVP
jgi:hypothetical protein